MNKVYKKYAALLVAILLLTVIIPALISRCSIKEKGQYQDISIKVLMPDQTIEEMTLEEYLIGVVAAEMPAEFELEALKAQAVAARTYAYKKITAEPKQEQAYDLDTTVQTQAWSSKKELYQRWGLIDYWNYYGKIKQAVQATRDQIVTYNGKEIDAVFHSSCGRLPTECSGDVWQTDIEYLKNVDSGEKEPVRFVKNITFDKRSFLDLLGFPAGLILDQDDIAILERSRAGRIKTLAVLGRVYKGTDFRAKLKLPSTDFEWSIQQDKIEFMIFGNGHGVGMSQYGANDLAKEGLTYSQILAHYYPGTELQPIE